MHRLRQFHEMKLKVDHRFNLFDQIDFYEKLWNGRSSAYRDYQKTKENVFSLRSYIERYKSEDVLTHIDAVPDNFLFTTDIDGNEDIRLIDWEYAGMQDPHLDIAMFCIYSLYNKEKVDQLISLYLQKDVRTLSASRSIVTLPLPDFSGATGASIKDISVLISANIPCVSTDTPKNITALYKTN